MYEQGADYIDIVGLTRPEDEQDEILVAVPNEYMHTGRESDIEKAQYKEMPKQEIEMEGVANIVETEKKPLTKNLLNDLLDKS